MLKKKNGGWGEKPEVKKNLTKKSYISYLTAKLKIVY